MVYHRLRRCLSWLRKRPKVGESKIGEMSGWVEVERLGFHWRVDVDTYVGRCIAMQGIFEPDTTRLVADFVKPGMTVLDVGANIGYFTLLFARAVGASGMVWAFEPTEYYREQLKWHVEHNGLSSQVRVFPLGLSDASVTCPISLGDSSATLHWESTESPFQEEQIELRPLDDIVKNVPIEGIDFVKVDIDGHEPRFLQGAKMVLRKYHPPMVLEFAQANLFVAGTSVDQQAQLLREMGYVLCDERTRTPYESELSFLKDCGNYNRSCNVLAIWQGMNMKNKDD